MSGVICQVSGVRCQVSRAGVTCHIFSSSYKELQLVGGGSVRGCSQIMSAAKGGGGLENDDNG